MKKLSVNPKHISLFTDEAPDQVTHFVRTGFRDTKGNSEWFMFVEDAYELEPHQSGVRRVTEDDIQGSFGFSPSEVIKKRQEKIYNYTGNSEKLIQLLIDQTNQLSIMSKIELGDDVIEEIKKLQSNLDTDTSCGCENCECGKDEYKLNKELFV